MKNIERGNTNSNVPQSCHSCQDMCFLVHDDGILFGDICDLLQKFCQYILSSHTNHQSYYTKESQRYHFGCPGLTEKKDFTNQNIPNS